jgi:lipopolysaccharide export system ATP-binding protein
MALLEVHGLVKSYGKRRVVNGVSFHVDRGEVVGLLGPNGAGKTTTFRMTIGMVVPDEGRVVFAGQDVTSWPMYKRARLGMGYLSQESSVFRRLTVEQNILAILEAMPPLRSLGRRLTRQERWQLTLRMARKIQPCCGYGKPGPGRFPVAKNADWKSLAAWSPNRYSSCSTNPLPA